VLSDFAAPLGGGSAARRSWFALDGATRVLALATGAAAAAAALAFAVAGTGAGTGPGRLAAAPLLARPALALFRAVLAHLARASAGRIAVTDQAGPEPGIAAAFLLPALLTVADAAPLLGMAFLREVLIASVADFARFAAPAGSSLSCTGPAVPVDAARRAAALFGGGALLRIADASPAVFTALTGIAVRVPGAIVIVDAEVDVGEAAALPVVATGAVLAALVAAFIFRAAEGAARAVAVEGLDLAAAEPVPALPIATIRVDDATLADLAADAFAFAETRAALGAGAACPADGFTAGLGEGLLYAEPAERAGDQATEQAAAGRGKYGLGETIELIRVHGQPPRRVRRRGPVTGEYVTRLENTTLGRRQDGETARGGRESDVGAMPASL